MGQGALGGGLIRCMITDARTSEDTAISDRAATLVQVQATKKKGYIDQIERRYTMSCTAMSNLQAECSLVMEKEEKIAAAHKEAVVQFERAKQTLGAVLLQLADLPRKCHLTTVSLFF